MKDRKTHRLSGSLRLLAAALLLQISQCVMADITVKSLNNESVGLEMQDKTLYTVEEDITLIGTESGQSALAVHSGATVTIYIKKGCKLTVKGADAERQVAAAPGILVPVGSTLIITGEGRLVATGGKVGAGSNGSRGIAGWINIPNNNGAGGTGGVGGAGGGGAAPGIGGKGGNGCASYGRGPLGTTKKCDGNDFDGTGNDGYNAKSGSSGDGMGTVYVLGTVAVEAYSGNMTVIAASGGSYGPSGQDNGSGWFYDYTSGGGGGGGGGGSGYAALFGIGGGGAGGQCGATGGSGGTMKNSGSRTHLWGQGGAGGKGAVDGAGGNSNYGSGYNKRGGYGGKASDETAICGSNGTLYCQRTNGLTIVPARSWTTSFTMPSVISTTHTLNTLNANSDVVTAKVYYGVKPSKVAVPKNGTKLFLGYFDKEALGEGEMVYNGSGKAVNINTDTEDRQLYAHWANDHVKIPSSVATNYKATANTRAYYINDLGVEVPVSCTVDAEVVIGDISMSEFFIVEGNTTVRHFVPTKKSAKNCLFEEITKKDYLLSSGTLVYNMGVQCSHVINGGHTAFHKISEDDAVNPIKYTRQCYLCDAQETDVLTTDFVRTNGNSYLDTGYKPNDKSQIYVEYEQCGTYTDNHFIFGTETLAAKYAFGAQKNSQLNMILLAAATGETEYQTSTLREAESDIQYNVLMANGSIAVSEDEYANKTVWETSWQSALTSTLSPLTSNLSPLTSNLYIGCINSDGTPAGYTDIKIFSLSIMESGKLLHHFIPGFFNQELGFYDVIDRKFVPMSGTGATNYVYRHDDGEGFCSHQYSLLETSDGEQHRHCYLCDAVYDNKYYCEVSYSANCDSYLGTMNDDKILQAGRLSDNLYSRTMCKMDSWNTRADGSGKKFANQEAIVPTASLKGPLPLYAQWTPCYAVQGDTIAIPADKVVSSISIYDDSDTYYGLTTREKIKVSKFLFRRMHPSINGQTSTTKWGTMCTPVTLTSNDSVTYYTAAKIQDNSLVLTQVETVEANTPCIYKLSAKCDSLHLLTRDIEFDGTVNNLTPAAGDVEIIGTYERLSYNVVEDRDYDYYAFSDNCFYHVNSSLVVNPFRSYIRVRKSSAAKAQLFILDHEPTAIDAVSESGGTALPDGKYAGSHGVIIVTGSRQYTVGGQRE